MTTEDLMRTWNEIALLIEAGTLRDGTADSLRRSAHRDDLIEEILVVARDGAETYDTRLGISPEQALIEACEYVMSQHGYP